MSALASPAPRLVRVQTPEGVALPFTVASIGDRLGAFLIDLAVITGCTSVVVVLAAIALLFGAGFLTAVALVASFLLRNLYFVACEVGWGGKTFGKRALGLRVIARDGGPLTADAAFARNLTREVELFLPLSVLLAPQALFGEVPGWIGLLSGAWLLLFAALPFFGKDHLRGGDLVAGTLVVRLPRALLLPDLAAASGYLSPSRADEIVFSREQLDLYGIHELQVLEDVLRRQAEGTLAPNLLADIGERIQRKIGWPPERRQVPTLPFLEAFYRAQRERLERKMLFGRRQERKRE